MVFKPGWCELSCEDVDVGNGKLRLLVFSEVACNPRCATEARD
jgi:hypothetical protein